MNGYLSVCVNPVVDRLSNDKMNCSPTSALLNEVIKEMKRGVELISLLFVICVVHCVLLQLASYNCSSYVLCNQELTENITKHL